MAEIKTVIVPLNGKNYPTWKVQCRMALMKDSLWGIVSGTEETPGEENADARRKFIARRDRALAIIVLAVDRHCYIYWEIWRIQKLSGRS